MTFVNLYNSIWICDYFSLQLKPNLSVSFINGLYCWVKAQFIPLAFLSAASESVSSKFGLIHLEKGEFFWRKTLTLLVEVQRTKHNSTIKRPRVAELWTYPFVLEVQINFRESLHRFHGFNFFANCYQRNCTRRKCAAWSANTRHEWVMRKNNSLNIWILNDPRNWGTHLNRREVVMGTGVWVLLIGGFTIL